MTALLVIARAVQIGASLLIAGIFTFEILIGRPGDPPDARANLAEKHLLHLALWAGVASFLSALVWFFCEVTSMSGLPLTRAFAGRTWEIVFTSTRFGLVWQFRLGLIFLILALTALRLLFHLRLAVLRFALWLCSFALLVLLAGISHPAATSMQPFGVLNDGLHLSAAAAWLGGLPCLAIYLTTMSPSAATPILQRFSTLSLCCVSVLVLSGIANAWLLLGSLLALFTTAYGKLLLLKLVLFTILLGFGARNRLLVRIVARGTSPSSALLAKVRRNARWEIGLGLGVIAVVGLLGATAPPHASHSHHGTLIATASEVAKS